MEEDRILKCLNVLRFQSCLMLIGECNSRIETLEEEVVVDMGQEVVVLVEEEV